MNTCKRICLSLCDDFLFDQRGKDRCFALGGITAMVQDFRMFCSILFHGIVNE
ncbi:MAG: hypothetical protein RL275_2695, partial [Chloroflexota bacterium]